VVLLDEPFAGVDAVTESVIREVFRSLAAAGRLVVAVHHDLSTVAGLFDRVVLVNGRLIAEGPTDAVFTPALIARTYGVAVAA
jgi:manganese/zinc/iron transport system ATP- binding protein